MKCTNCGKEIPENSKFCLECGAAVVQEKITCKKCGQALPSGAKFCNNCGETVNGTTTNADNEIKIVIERKKQMLNDVPADVYIDDEFLGTFRKGDFINYKLDASKAASEIKIRIALVYYFNRARNLYMTVKINEAISKRITVIQTNGNTPDVELEGFDVISKSQTSIERYNSPKI